MSTSQNGWPVLAPGSDLLHSWIVPDTNRHLVMRHGSAGFLLADVALWFHEQVERLDLGIWDDWGWAHRAVRGYPDVWSNHASGTAMDLNATRHPLTVPTLNTFTPAQVDMIRRRLLRRYRGAVAWGGSYVNRPDAMHFEISKHLQFCERVARDIMPTPRGRRVLEANPGQRAVILS